MKMSGTLAAVGFPDIGLPDFLQNTNRTKNQEQIHSVPVFAYFAYFAVQIFLAG
jgi:hypothetical protein